MENVIDTHIHLTEHRTEHGLANEWVTEATENLDRNWTLKDYAQATKSSEFHVQGAVFVECSNVPPIEEAKWALRMVDDPESIIVAVVAQIDVVRGKEAVEAAIEALKLQDGTLPKGLKGARRVFLGPGYDSPDACLAPTFLEGLKALQEHGLLWEFCCAPTMAPNIANCCRNFPEMTFVIDHLAHNGNDGGEMETWGPAMDELGRLENVFCKMGAIEQWDVDQPEKYLDRAIAAFGFHRIMYESNWFCNEALGFSYNRTASLLKEACLRAGASASDIANVFEGNAKRVYSLE